MSNHKRLTPEVIMMFINALREIGVTVIAESSNAPRAQGRMTADASKT